MAFAGATNKDGQIRRKPLRDAMNALLLRSPDDPLNDKPKNIAQSIALRVVKEALMGDNPIPAFKELRDMTEGKPAQAIVGGDDDDNPILQHVTVSVVRAKHTDS